MKNFKKIFIALMSICAIVAATPADANAQFRFGIKAGMNVNKVSFSKDDLGSNFSSDNRTGWMAGVMTEFTVPIIGIGLDASLLYSHHGKLIAGEDTSLDYLQLPINLKYKINLPMVSNIITPFIATGPSFAVKCSKDAVLAGVEEKKFDVAWNAAVGAELIKHLQISVGYSWGMNKLYKMTGLSGTTVDVGRLNGWVISAAYLF